MLLTRSFARKMFGEQDPLGKKIQFRNKDYTVTGILKDIPVNSSFRFDVLIPDRPEFSRMMSEFIVLKEKVGIQSVKEKLLPEKFMVPSISIMISFRSRDCISIPGSFPMSLLYYGMAINTH